MTIEDNVAFGLKMKKVSKEERKKRVKKMLELVHLEGYEKRKPKDLSGGEQQRVSIIRGLINNPKVLLLDEPLSALDLKLRKKMQIELKQLQKKLGITFIYVTHSQDEALSMSDRIVVLNKGKIEQVGTPIEVYEKPNSLFVANFLGDSNVFTGKIKHDLDEKSVVSIDNKLELTILDNKYKVGDTVNVIVRPENIKITKKERKHNCLEGIIQEQIYDGYFTKVLVKVNEEIIQVIISGNDKLYKNGDNVYLYWTIDDSIILGKEKNEKRK
jgi:spermidine/putrescine transport system ATP-binding protein